MKADGVTCPHARREPMRKLSFTGWRCLDCGSTVRAQDVRDQVRERRGSTGI